MSIPASDLNRQSRIGEKHYDTGAAQGHFIALRHRDFEGRETWSVHGTEVRNKPIRIEQTSKAQAVTWMNNVKATGSP